MKVIFDKTGVYENVSRATRTESEAVLYLDDGGKAEFIGVHDWSVFEFEGGDWTAPEPTQLDQIEAQAMYTALMTDTLLEEE